jgi:hypothetical protein
MSTSHAVKYVLREREKKGTDVNIISVLKRKVY